MLYSPRVMDTQMDTCPCETIRRDTDWPCAETYQKLVAEVEAMDRETFRAKRAELIKRDRAVSEELIELDVPHYSLRYSHVMGVRSDFVKWERRLEASTREEQAVVYTLE